MVDLLPFPCSETRPFSANAVQLRRLPELQKPDSLNQRSFGVPPNDREFNTGVSS